MDNTVENEFTRLPITFSDATITLPKGCYEKEKEVYVSVVKGALYIKSRKQFSKFMNGAKRLGYGKIAMFYRECMNNSYVVDYDGSKFEVCPEIAEVLSEDEPCEAIVYHDNSGVVVAKKSFFDEKIK